MSIIVEVDTTKGLGTGDILAFDEQEDCYEIVKIIDDTHITISVYKEEVSIH